MVPRVEGARVRLVLAVHALGPPVCTAADGAVEHASLGAARRARGGKAPEGFGAYTASMHMRQDATHVVALRAVEHAASPILKAGTCG